MARSKVVGVSWLVIALLTLGYTLYQRNSGDVGRFFVVPTVIPNHEQSLFKSGFIESSPAVPRVHAATGAPVEDGILAIWYAGTREGHKDVSLYQARYHKQKGWSVAEVILNRKQAADQLGIYIRKLGNPVLHRAPDGRLWLFFVTVSHGGWAGSQINVMISEDEGQSWGEPKALVTSPFINISTLVKGKAVQLSEGVIGLPVYHEFIQKYGEFLRVSSEAEVLHKSRIAHAQGAIQPSLVVHSKKDAIAYLRASRMPEKKVYQAVTHDAGVHWQGIGSIELPNSDSSVDTLVLADGSTLMVLNNSTSNRENLTLMSNKNEGRWTLINVLEYVPEGGLADFEGNNPEYSYPFMLHDDEGNIHLLYTWHRTHIKHVIFNDAWLNQQENES